MKGETNDTAVLWSFYPSGLCCHNLQSTLNQQ